ncbi:hypothetical protein scyTo_0001071 [Scyliorhinus torazame]|uniref:Cilia- and flagella-associated protein 299 n=1 Tax=Scyliorhinus torazame TaxID=75743 RepID=A0A401P8R0_SCYTO|nr:hypothetical protein [Scyliorhinus torazame]
MQQIVKITVNVLTLSIIFIRDYNSHGQEISGYIDYSHRLKTEQFEGYFGGKKKLMPRSTDLRIFFPPCCLQL